MKKYIVFLFCVLLLMPSVFAATIQGTSYDYSLEPLQNVIIEINTVPVQQFLSRDGSFEIVVSPGEYILSARSNGLATTETFIVENDGIFLYDLFLFSSLAEEDELLGEVEEVVVEDVDTPQDLASRFLSVLVIFAAAFGIGWYLLRRKEGKDVPESLILPGPSIEKNIKPLVVEKIEEKQESLPIEDEPGYLVRALDIIKKHDGRITQKELRKEMMDLSESKVSLIITELEHKGKVEKVKRGRGNVILLKR
jgi:uncharacterized membrane protein